MPDLIGKSFGRYHILEQLGEGGMATVYKAYDTRLETNVAVKVIRTENILPSLLGKTLKRFEREAKALAHLSHPNIVKVTDYGEFEGKPYLVMPFLPGGTLKQQMGKSIPWQEAVQIIKPIAEALDYAHKQKMVHRDVKPSNILLTQLGQPTLTDFGIAKVLDLEETLELTGTSAAMGSPEYMAPEQATARTVDHRADIYALGVVLYEMVTGYKPFTADTPLAVLFKHASDPLPNPKVYAPNLPDGVEKILLKAMAKKPDDRYQSMGELVNALDSLQHDQASQLVTEAKPQKQIKTLKRIRENKPLVGSKTLMLFAGVSGFALLAVFGLPKLFGSSLNLSPTAAKETAPTLTLTIPAATASQTQELAQTTATSEITATVTESSTPTSTPLPIEFTDAKGAQMVFIPAGEFIMGVDVDKALEECNKVDYNCGTPTDQFNSWGPERTVYLDNYYIDKFEVTNSLYKLCVDSGKCQPPRQGSYSRASYFYNSVYNNYPVIHIHWAEAKTYCTWRGARLPTEAEWEKAARGTDGRTYPWGEVYHASYTNASNGINDTSEVGSYPKDVSPYGVYDMYGNVIEWVDEGIPNAIRGQSWFGGSGFTILATSRGITPYNTFEYGFRCAMDAPQE